MSEARSYKRRIPKSDGNWPAIIAFGFLFIIVVIGVACYTIIEDMSFTEAGRRQGCETDLYRSNN